MGILYNKNIKYYGSQGQHRLCVLSLKLAELEIIKHNIISEKTIYECRSAYY